MQRKGPILHVDFATQTNGLGLAGAMIINYSRVWDVDSGTAHEYWPPATGRPFRHAHDLGALSA